MVNAVFTPSESSEENQRKTEKEEEEEEKRSDKIFLKNIFYKPDKRIPKNICFENPCIPSF